MLTVNKINHNIFFKGRIIDAHTHVGYWDKPDGKPYELKDIFEITNKTKIDGDTVEKVIVSSLYCLKTDSNGKPLAGELEGNKAMLESIKNNKFAAPLAVCQPGIGSVKNIEELFEKNPNSFVGLKIHPKNLKLRADDEAYKAYLEFAEKNNLPCLFHSQCAIDYDKSVLKTAIEDMDPSDPRFIYSLAKKTSKVPVILGHMGAGGKPAHEKALEVLLESINTGDANLYADISWVGIQSDKNIIDTEMIIKAIKELKNTSKGDKTDRLLFGTDAPIAEFSEVDGLYTRFVREIKSAIKKNFGDEEGEKLIDKIFYQNSADLFKLDAQEVAEKSIKKGNKILKYFGVGSLVLLGLAGFTSQLVKKQSGKTVVTTQDTKPAELKYNPFKN